MSRVSVRIGRWPGTSCNPSRASDDLERSSEDELMKIELNMTVYAYSTSRVLLHWFSAAIILWTLASGFYVALAQVSPPLKQGVAFINVSLTTVLIPFFGWRLALFIASHRSSALRRLSWAERCALAAHTLIYFIVTLVLATGVLMMDRPINVFDLFTFAQPVKDPQWLARFFNLHVGACLLLAALILLHVGAVVVHERRGQRILRHMALSRRHCLNGRK